MQKSIRQANGQSVFTSNQCSLIFHGMIVGEVSQLRTITKISRQKKAANRYNIFLDEVYAFGVSEDMLVKFNLRKGLSLTETEIEEITKNDDWHRVYAQAIRYLSYRMRSEKEMRAYLQKQEATRHVIDGIIERLKREKYLDDAAFADAFVKDRMNHSSKGPALIIKELSEKGISHRIVNEALKQYSYERQRQTALKWAEKQQKRKSSQSYRKRNEQLKMKLMQKGFSREIADDAVTEAKPPLDEEAEYDSLQKQADKLYRRYRKRYEGNELQLKLKSSLYNRGFQGDLIDEYVAKLEE